MLPIILLASFGTAQATFVPLVLIALLLDSAIVSVWYIIGFLLSNSTVKSSALTELYQVGGTALLIVLIAALLTSFSSAFFNILGSTRLMNPSAISQACSGPPGPSGALGTGGVMGTTQINILQKTGAYLAGSSSPAFPGLCNMVNPYQSQTVTTMMDYPLAAVGVILANVTNQTVNNLNSAFIFDAFTGFLKNLTPSVTFCTGFEPEVPQCLVPEPLPLETTMFGVSYRPDAGFVYIYSALAPLGALMTNAFMMAFAQLTFVVLFIFAWPYLVFIGLVLRSSPFTRGMGGLLIATAIGMVLFYPLIYSLEYLGLANGGAQSGASIYGYNSITNIPGRSVVVCPGEAGGPACMSGGSPIAGAAPLCNNVMPYSPYCADSTGKEISGPYTFQCPIAYQPTCSNYAQVGCSTGAPSCTSGQAPDCVDSYGNQVSGAAPTCSDGSTPSCTAVTPTCNYTVNFFVEPNIQNAALKFGCWPEIAGVPQPLNAAEFADIGYLLIPFANLIFQGLGSAGAFGLPSWPLPAPCGQLSALQTLLSLQQAYGIIGITSYLLPILNLFITIAAILGVSGLLGGDTSLAGLSRLL